MAILKILLIEDHREWQGILRRGIDRALRHLGRASTSSVRDVAEFNEASDALEHEGPWHLLVTDIGLGPNSQQKLGMQLAEYARDLQIPTIVVSGTSILEPQDGWELSRRYKVIDFFNKKDFDSDKFIATVQKALQPTELDQSTESEASEVLSGFRHDAFISYSHDDSIRRYAGIGVRS